MVTKGDYNEAMVQAAHSVLLEVMRVLGEYREDIAVVGGWVPELVIPDSSHQYDIARNFTHHVEQ